MSEYEYKRRITGRVEEWMKSICQNNNCKYYIHQDYPSCSYCTHPTNCILTEKTQAERSKK